MTSRWWIDEVDRLDVSNKTLRAALLEITDFERSRATLSEDAKEIIKIAKVALDE